MTSTCKTHRETRPVATYAEAAAHVESTRQRYASPQLRALFAVAASTSGPHCCAAGALAKYYTRAAWRAVPTPETFGPVSYTMQERMARAALPAREPVPGIVGQSNQGFTVIAAVPDGYGTGLSSAYYVTATSAQGKAVTWSASYSRALGRYVYNAGNYFTAMRRTVLGGPHDFAYDMAGNRARALSDMAERAGIAGRHECCNAGNCEREYEREVHST